MRIRTVENESSAELFAFSPRRPQNIAPLLDAVVSEQYAEADAMILFHDRASPAVALGLDYLRGRGWKTLLYQTTQIIAAAWRGQVVPLRRILDGVPFLKTTKRGPSQVGRASLLEKNNFLFRVRFKMEVGRGLWPGLERRDAGPTSF